ncbi:MAG: trehalose-phosphatase [Acidobacteria bacterium]|nr:trehalose-phosphatase [Acidobacteriota bacterium]
MPPTAPALRAVAARAAEAGLFLDFDGTLSEIVLDPGEARAARGASSVLARLARSWRSVVVVSGRSAADLARRVRAPGVRLLGLHGVEEIRDGEVRVLPRAEAARAAVERAAARLERDLAGVRGAHLERKGLALAVHFRRARDPEEAERIAGSAVVAAAAAEGLAVVSGRMILEVRAREGGDKGDALRRIAREEGLRAILVAGDDVGDLPAFRAAGELEACCRVAVASDESPAELTGEADLVVGSPADLVALLRRLARGT